MSSNPPFESEKNMISGTDDKFERLSEEAMSLRIVEKFLCEVERNLLRANSAAFDVASIKECLQILKPKENPVNSEGRLNAAFRMTQEFELWRNLLEEKDRNIETFHIRRFCDSMRNSLNTRVFLALARFYRDLPLSPASQSKFDLVMTRAFTAEGDGSIRHHKMDRDQVAVRIASFFEDWNNGCDSVDIDPIVVRAAVDRFDDYSREAAGLSEFEALIDSNIFERIRGFKRELGKTYFHPKCVAAAIACNMAVGNVFASLLAKVNENLQEQLSSQFDFAGAFLDASADSQMPIFDLLNELNIVGQTEADGENNELAFMRKLLRHAVFSRSEPPATDTEVDESSTNVDNEETVKPVKERLAEILATISQPQPDKKLLRDHMQLWPALDVLDLNDFLYTCDDEPDVLGRRALAAILCLEELKENDLKGNKTLEPEMSDEVVSMLHFAEKVGDALAGAVQVADQSSQNRLLTVSNSLLSTRLQVERAVMRFTSQAEELEEEQPVEEIVEPSSVTPFEITRSSFAESNRWLMAATVIVTLLCSSILFFSGQSYNAAPLPEDVEEIVVTRLPQPNHLEQAFRKNNTLFVTAKSSWENLPDEEKRKALQGMVEVEMRKPLQVVIVIDGNGRPLGDISPVGISILAEPPVTADSK